MHDWFANRPLNTLFHTILIFISLSYYCYRIIMCYTQVVDIVKIEYKNKSVPLISVSLDDSCAGHAGPHSRSMLSTQGFKKINISANQKLAAPYYCYLCFEMFIISIFVIFTLCFYVFNSSHFNSLNGSYKDFFIIIS